MRPRPLLLLFLLAACADPTIVEVQRLAPGGGRGGLGGADAVARNRPTLDIVIRLEADATDFVPGDLMRVMVNGTERVGDVVLGGLYGLLRLDGGPILDTPQTVELFKRTGPRKDSYTYTVTTYTGPTLTGADLTSGQTGTIVRLTGAGFLGGAARVFFGGIEAAVVAVVDDSNLDATVPVGAFPGLIYVQIGSEAAEGLVDFQPLNAGGDPVPRPDIPALFGAFPACGVTETVVELYGVNIDQFAFPEFNDRISSQVFGVEEVVLPVVGPVVRAFAVVFPDTDPGAGQVRLDEFGFETNDLPFTVK